MVGTSQTVPQESPRYNRGAIRLHEDLKGSDEARLKKLGRKKLGYRKRRAAGLCTHGRCPERAESGHAHCRKHLQAMANHATERRNDRIAQDLCVRCGERPPFWGRRCVICRQELGKNPLPYGARRALRLYREAEHCHRSELIRREAQLEARKLLANGKIRGKAGEALRLYMGLDDGKWRTYREIGSILKVSGERVRQLLLPSKIELSEAPSGRARWGPLTRPDSNGKCGSRPCPKATCTHRKALRISDDGSYQYKESGLPSVLLFGMTAHRCQGCQVETVVIPRVSDLNRTLAREILLKPTLLTGRELRFLRIAAGLSPASLAQLLEVTFRTILTWEDSETLRGPNDIAARMVVAALIFGVGVCVELFKLVKDIRKRNRKAPEIRAQWLQAERRWVSVGHMAP